MFFFDKSKNNHDPTKKKKTAYLSIIDEARTQNKIVINNPPAELTWYFMQKNFIHGLPRSLRQKDFKSQRNTNLFQFKKREGCKWKLKRTLAILK